MKIGTARRALYCGCGLMAVCFLLAFILDKAALIDVGGAFALAGAIIWTIWGRCPACRKFIGPTAAEHCPHCGAKIEESRDGE